jgi:ethanolamine utilization microcompartment shell protein EutL
MTKTALSKSELADKVRESIRQYRGCDQVDAIVLYEIKRPKARWEIAVIVASSGDSDAVRIAAEEVQKQLQARYRITSEPMLDLGQDFDVGSTGKRSRNRSRLGEELQSKC